MFSLPTVLRTGKAICQREPNLKRYHLVSSWQGRIICFFNFTAYGAQQFTDPPFFLYRSFKHLIKGATYLCLAVKEHKMLSRSRFQILKIRDDLASLAFSPFANLIMMHKFFAGIIHPKVCYRPADQEEAKIILSLELFEKESIAISEKAIDELTEFNINKKTYRRLNEIHKQRKLKRKEFLNTKIYVI